MEKKLTKKELQALRQAAMIEAAMIDSLNILLTGDRRHDSDLRVVLALYVCSLPATFKRNIGTTELWDGYIRAGYEQLLRTADDRLPGFSRSVTDMLKGLEDLWDAQDRKEAEKVQKGKTASGKGPAPEARS